MLHSSIWGLGPLFGGLSQPKPLVGATGLNSNRTSHTWLHWKELKPPRRPWHAVLGVTDLTGRNTSGIFPYRVTHARKKNGEKCWKPNSSKALRRNEAWPPFPSRQNLDKRVRPYGGVREHTHHHRPRLVHWLHCLQFRACWICAWQTLSDSMLWSGAFQQETFHTSCKLRLVTAIAAVFAERRFYSFLAALLLFLFRGFQNFRL